MHKQVWRGAVHDDDDSYVSTGTGEDEEEDEDDDDDDDVSDMDEEERAGAKAAKKAKKEKSKRSGLRQEIAELKEKLKLDDSSSTPQMGEAMADFYSRTSDYWTQKVATQLADDDSRRENETLSNKELKREGFLLAQKRYEELRPMLDRLNELELQQRDAEEAGRVQKSKKKEKKKNRGK
eukprot:CAMPEP_0116823404 /NCGR_PEP_ID=MMETSP0418-20121206/817_1 /TAXON_ID=1158023 /ORGANISM="Astrosyne radiata, Strain 13vi08-1A" /LENGTH=179 /DNA_ID=CAMNT_0004451649 /DNA_START=75 /DNA_END=614 /DNA_ORIENTATION=-